MAQDTSPPPIEVAISNTQRHLEIDPEALARLVRHALLAEGVAAASISLALVDNATIHRLNRRYLGHDWPTDVISFRLSEVGEVPLVGRAGDLGRDGGSDRAGGRGRSLGRAGAVRGPWFAAPLRP